MDKEEVHVYHSSQPLEIADIKLGNNNRGKTKCKVFTVIATVVVLAVIAGVITWAVLRDDSEPPAETDDNPTKKDIPESELRRIDCYPETGGGVETVDQVVGYGHLQCYFYDIETSKLVLYLLAKCEARGCIWQISEFVQVPACFVPQPESEQEFGYRVISGPENTEFGQRWYLQRINQFAIYDENIEFLTFDVEYRDNHLLRFKFDDTNDSGRFKVPVPINLGSVRAPDPEYEVQVEDTGTFSFRVLRKDTGTVLWDTSVGGFAFANQFLQISTRLPSENLYGMGENLHFSFRHNLDYQTWPLWSRDQPPHSGDETMNQNLYSVHPFYECLEEDGNSHGVLLLNANAMDYTLTPLPMLTYKTIGGILDFYMFLGPAPENVVHQYTQAVGMPYMPPYFMLGFQISRFGYRNTNMIRESVDRNLANDIPFDVQYVDIDHMYKYRDFTLDNENFGDLPEYFEELREMGLKTIIILDPTLEVNDTYQPYIEGVEQDIFIKWPNRESMPDEDYEERNRTDMMGAVWPEYKCVFPDFFLNETATLWIKWLVDFREVISFDALWLDMNEPANFDTNKWRSWNWPEDDPTNWTLKCPNNTWDDPPYRTKAAFLYDDPNEGLLERLSSKTICMIGTQEHSQSIHYNMHNLYGWKQAIVSLESIRAAVLASEGIEKRTMVVSRSTYPGSAQHTGRWLGDNASRWKDLQLSIVGMLEFNIMGFPYVGSDICGFFENCTAELCKRWQEVGAFYPYARNHNHMDPHPQDPAFFGPEVVNPTKSALEIRYRLLPHLYTLFHRTHIHGDTVIRPVFHEFPRDNNTWTIERQFLWGAALLFSPILEQGQTELSYYLPRGRWYDWYTNSLSADTDGEWHSIPVNENTPIQVHIRGGYILPWQTPANNTHFSRRNTFGVKAALDSSDGEAVGALFWDDGESIDTYENGKYYAASYVIDTNTLSMSVEHHGTVEGLDELLMDTVQVLGVSQANFIYVNDAPHTDFTFDAETQYLEITNLQLPMVSNFRVVWRASELPLTTLLEAERIDCCPELCDQTGCEAKACLWTESSIPGVPWCYLNNDLYGYSGSTSSEDGTYTSWKGQSSMFGGDIEQVRITTEEYNYVYRIKLEDHNDPNRYQVPLPLNLEDDGPDDLFNMQLDFEPSFSMKLTRTGEETGLVDTSIGGLTFADQFLQLTTRLASMNVYGFGEHIHSALKHNLQDYNSWGMFARDEPPKGNGVNLYSTHPFYMVVEETGRCHGVLFWNSNAMEVVFLPSPALTIRALGGIMDIYVIVGDSPEQLIQRYHQMIGFAYLPPYWALGFQISRYGYETLDNMQSIVERNVQANIPLDVVYLDIDSLDERKSFTWDMEEFAGLPEYLDYLHTVHINNIIIIDPFLISNETNYPPYDLGLQSNLFIKWPEGTNPDFDIHNNDNLLGWAWPTGYCVFPDFFHSNSTSYWELLIQNYHTELKFDGLWLDMNEPANFGTNEDKPWNWPDDVLPYWSLKCPQDNAWDNPPYKPGSLLGQWLCDKTICMTALQGDSSDMRHYNLHSLYGHSQTLPTLSGLRKVNPGKRGLVITRSTFPSTGVYGGRWLGDNAAIWPHLKDSIIGMLEFNIFGIPYVGADICGYFDSCPEELCQRWQQLGAFYPYSRNHNGIGYDDQDPGAYSPGMQASTRKALETRYRLLPYLYTLFYFAHTRGGTVARPLFHEFPTDTRALDVDEQFLWGPALLISPVLDQGVIQVSAYFPESRWFDYYTGTEVDETGRAHIVDAPLDHIPLHVRGGHVIPQQQPANSTFYSRQNPFELLVVPDDQNQGQGDLFWDDGESVDTIANNVFCLLHFEYAQNTVNMSVVQSNSPDLDGLFLDRVRVFGITEAPDTVTSEPVSATLVFAYNPDTKVLTIEDIQINMATELIIRWE